MPSKAHSPSVRARQARIYSPAAEVAGLADRVKVDREGGRIRVTLTRKYQRIFYLGDDEAAYLSALLNKQLMPVTVSRKSLACNAQAHGECVISVCGCPCHREGGES